MSEERGCGFCGFTLHIGQRKKKDSSNVLMTMGALFSFGFYIFLSLKFVWIEEKITSRIPWLMILASSLALIIFIIIKPADIFTNITSMITNFYVNGLWGATSIVLTFLLMFLPLPRLDHTEDQIFSKCIILFFILTVLVGGLRDTYRVGWSDSANRMMMHIFPTACLYILVKFRNITEASQYQIDEMILQKKFKFYIIGAAMLVFIFLALLGFTMFGMNS